MFQIRISFYSSKIKYSVGLQRPVKMQKKKKALADWRVPKKCLALNYLIDEQLFFLFCFNFVF